jgi:hypothetical protein
MTALAFGVAATLGSLRYDGGIARARIESMLAPGIGSARIVLPRELREEAAVGDDVVVELTGESGESEQVFGGTVAAVQRSTPSTTVVSIDASGRLAAQRLGSTYDQRTAKALIGAMAHDAGVDVGALSLDLPLVGYVADQRRTGWEHIARIVAWAGAIATTDAEGRLVVTPTPSPPANLALRYGREIATLRVAARRAPIDGGVWIVGSGPAGSADAADARVPAATTLPADLGSPSPDLVRRGAPALRTPAAAATATAAVRAASTARLSAECWLVPQIRAGTTIEIADAPQQDAKGPWLVTRVVHEVGPGPRGRTRIAATGLAAAGGSLLDAAVAAVGSLLS